MGAVAAIIVRKENDVVAEFERHRATSPESARQLSMLGLQDDRTLGRLRDRAVVREAAPGMYYLDEVSLEAFRRGRRRILSILLVIAVCVVAAAWMSGRGDT